MQDSFVSPGVYSATASSRSMLNVGAYSAGVIACSGKSRPIMLFITRNRLNITLEAIDYYLSTIFYVTPSLCTYNNAFKCGVSFLSVLKKINGLRILEHIFSTSSMPCCTIQIHYTHVEKCRQIIENIRSSSY